MSLLGIGPATMDPERYLDQITRASQMRSAEAQAEDIERQTQAQISQSHRQTSEAINNSQIESQRNRTNMQNKMLMDMTSDTNSLNKNAYQTLSQSSAA